MGMIDTSQPGHSRANGRDLLRIAGLGTAYFATIVSMSLVYSIINKGYSYKIAMLPFDSSLVAAGAVTSVGLWWLLKRIATQPFARQAVLAALSVAGASMLLQAVTNLLILLLIPGKKPWPLPGPLELIGQSLFWLLPLGLWSALLLARFHDSAARLREQRLADARAEAQEAQVRALRYQVNPHFLYNTLNSIASLILDGRGEAAEAMVMRLSDFLRATIESDATADVTLAEEIALQKLYLDIERLRFPDNLTIDIEIPPALRDARVPALILQPLIENALKYGVSHRGETRVRVAARQERDRLTIDVSDDGPGHGQSGGTGLGIANVRRRLAARFGDGAALGTTHLAQGFLVTLSFPLVRT